MRTKHRYILLKVVPYNASKNIRNLTERINNDDLLLSEIINWIKLFYGHIGCQKTIGNLKMIPIDVPDHVIVRCLHDIYKYITSVIPFIENVDGIRVKFPIVYIGGTIMQSKKKLLTHLLMAKC